MKVYHGTNKEFSKFDFSLIGTNTDDLDAANLGICFTENKSYAMDYATYSALDGGEPIIIKAEINIENPCEFSADDLNRFCEQYGATEYRQMLINDGYDGIINFTGDEKEYICFYPEQIKIIGGKNNA